jgi:Uma2 family endonuclease
VRTERRREASATECLLAEGGFHSYSSLMPTVVTVTDKVQRELWTAEDFLEWLKPGVHADLIDGEKFMHTPVNFKHARLLNFLHILLSLYVERKRLGEVHREVVAVRLSTRNVFMPDLCFFTNEQVARLAPAHAPFAPTLVVEALSPWSADRDVGPKFAAYEEHGVQEYWVLDPDQLAHRFYSRQGDLLVEFATGEEIIRAQTIPGFWLQRSWLNPDQPPEVSRCLGELCPD